MCNVCGCGSGETRIEGEGRGPDMEERIARFTSKGK